VGRSFT
jgi:hypothetical protein